ncbi:cytochrome P450 [Panus rudis PR-1116 ss-1]|nr:cytochrome P450 [Panus rudis PR-1116 ss-1]
MLLHAFWYAVVGVSALLLVRLFKRRTVLDNLPGPPPGSFIFGHLPRLFNRYAWDFHREIIYKYGPVSKLDTFFGTKCLYVFDPKALHNIVVKEQHIYEETPVFLNFNRIVFGAGLLSSLGEEHRRHRKILNPVFNINHMRYMTPIFYRVVHKMRNAIANEVESGVQEIDMLNWMTRAALELVGQGGLGHSFDSLEKDELNPFAEDIKALMYSALLIFIVIAALPFFASIGSPQFRRRLVEMIPYWRVRRSLEISDALDKTSREILRRKREALAQGDEAVSRQVGEGKDIMSVLLRENMAASEEDRMPDTELLGHMTHVPRAFIATLFFTDRIRVDCRQLIFAAMETTSGALAHILHLLAEHQDIQDKLREEILKAKEEFNGEDIPYDTLVSLPYIEAVCRESLRLYAPLTTINKTAIKDTVMPLSEPIRGVDGTMISEIPIAKGTDIMVGIWGSNINPALWGDDAEVFKPERWLKPLPEAVSEARIPGVYSNLMTFLGGGRACIGFKFSQLEMKVVLSILIESFKFELPEGKEIYWNNAGVQYPSVGRDGSKSELPLKVTLVK